MKRFTQQTVSEEGARTDRNGVAIGGLQRAAVVQSIRDAAPPLAVSTAKAAFTAYGRATSGARPLPDFLIIGTKKGGTTSMMSWLIEHPDVLRMFPRMQRRKSPHYFDMNYALGERWYRAHFPTSAARAIHTKRTGSNTLVGEASPYYMFHPAAAQRIHDTLPDVKLIVLLREPVARAYSNYWDRVATGHESLPTFESAIAAEEERLSGVSAHELIDAKAYSYHHDHHAYFARGRYAEQLRPFFSLFGSAQMLVLPADRMFIDAQATFDRVQSFLDLRRTAVPLLPRNERKGYPPIAPNTAARLKERYAPHNVDLFELLGEDFGWDTGSGAKNC